MWKKTIQRDLKGFNAFLLLRKDMHVTNHIILSYSGDESAGTGWWQTQLLQSRSNKKTKKH